MDNPMANVPVLSQEEFFTEMMMYTLSGQETNEHRWAVTVASMLGVVSLHHEGMSKGDIVAALQRLAIKVPETVLDESSAQLEAFVEANGL